MIRINSIELRNFKNVEHGKIQLTGIADVNTFAKPSIVGIYGQNGSGKTSVIEALAVVRRLLGGSRLEPDWSEWITQGRDKARIDLDYYLLDIPSEKYESRERDELGGNAARCQVLYSVELARKRGGSVYLASETLKYRNLRDGSRLSKLVSFETEATELFADKDNGEDSSLPEEDIVTFRFGQVQPMAPWKSLVSTSNESAAASFDQMRFRAAGSGSSFLFSRWMSRWLSGFESALAKEGLKTTRRDAIVRFALPLSLIVASSREFAVNDMEVVGNIRTSIIGLDLMTLSTRARSGERNIDSVLPFVLSRPAELMPDDAILLKSEVANINKVVDKVIPGLQFEVEDHGTTRDDAGELLYRVEVNSVRGGVRIPLRLESEGVKKIFSVFELLISVYWNPGACVAIDEIDSGVFEFLLGELVDLLGKRGRGQLVFTAHNLRPLEVLPNDSLRFSTTNPENRFIRLTGMRDANNLRDTYYRTIGAGGQDEFVYELTSPYEIDYAMRRAGHEARNQRLSAGDAEGGRSGKA